MNIIKLNAIDSTNSYLKELALKKDLENFTVAVAKHQTSGRGQMGTNWISEYDKNLTFSMLVKFGNLKDYLITSYKFGIQNIYNLRTLRVDLNCCTSCLSPCLNYRQIPTIAVTSADYSA